jgi:hypothetical protein
VLLALPKGTYAMIVRPVNAQQLNASGSFYEPPSSSSSGSRRSSPSQTPFDASMTRGLEQLISALIPMLTSLLSGQGGRSTTTPPFDPNEPYFGNAGRTMPRGRSNSGLNNNSISRSRSIDELPEIEVASNRSTNARTTRLRGDDDDNNSLFSNSLPSNRAIEQTRQRRGQLPLASAPELVGSDPVGSNLSRRVPSPESTRVYENRFEELWSNLPDYGDTGRTPDDAPRLGRARSRNNDTFGADRYGNWRGADGEAFRPPTNLVDDDLLSLINDVNEDTSLVLNGSTRIEKDTDGNEYAVIEQATVGLGDDLAIVVDADGARYAYNGQTFISMEDGKVYYANDGAAARWDEEQRQLRVSQEEYELALRHNDEDDAIAITSRMSDTNDGRALGLLGVTTAEGQQFKGRNNRQVASYAETYATVDADRPFSSAVRDHSARFNNNRQSGDEQAGVDFETVYSPEFYASSAELSDDTSRTAAPRDRN